MKIRLPLPKFHAKRPKKRRRSTVSSDICLVIHENTLFHAEKNDIVAQQDESLLDTTPSEVAEAARRLLPNVDKQQKIALALPAIEFVATSLDLPVIDEKQLKNAVKLQLPTLLPGISESLLVAVQPQLEGKPTVALWMREQRAEAYFQAFEKVGLFLHCILPRPLVSLNDDTQASQIYDEDEKNITYCKWSGQAIQRWVSLPKADCDNDIFQTQFDEFSAQLDQELPKVSRCNAEDWQNLTMPTATAFDYAIFPPKAIEHINALKKRRRQRYFIAAGVLLMAASIAAVVAVMMYKERLEQQLIDVRNQTTDVSHLKAEVLAIEDFIAPVKQFPQQDAIGILTTLNQLIPKDSWVSNLQIEQGAVTIEGYGPNSSTLLENIAAHPDFADVGFSRETRNERGKESFGIRFRLVNVDVPAYWLEYFPIDR